jgi:hypothetical protein
MRQLRYGLLTAQQNIFQITETKLKFTMMVEYRNLIQYFYLRIP